MRMEKEKGRAGTHPTEKPVELSIPQAEEIVHRALELTETGDKGALYEKKSVEALALIQSKEPATYARIWGKIKSLGVQLSELKKQIKTASKRNVRLRIVDPNESEELVLAGDILENCPAPTLIIPDGYTLSAAHGITKPTVKVIGGSEELVHVPVALDPVLISAMYRDITTRKESYRMLWLRNQKWVNQIVSREVAANSRLLVSLAGEGFPVTSGSSAELVTYLARFEKTNISMLPVANVSAHLGWQGEEGKYGFLLGKTLFRPDGGEVNQDDLNEIDPSEWDDNSIFFQSNDVGDEQIAKAFKKKGTLEGWMEAVKLAAPYPRALVALYASFVPPLLRILNCANFVVEWAFSTSTGKTTVLRLGGSTAGDPDEKSENSVIQTWNQTKVAVGRVAGMLNGLPLMLDDTKQAPSLKFVNDTIYLFAGGRDKQRGSLKGTQVSATWRTVLLSTAETKFQGKGGSAARVLSITSMPFDGKGVDTRKLVQEINRTVTTNYGHAMPLFLKWVMSKRDEWDKWKADFQEREAKYADSVEGNIEGRIAPLTAVIDLAARLVHQAFYEAGTPLPFKYADIFKGGLWEELTREVYDATGEEEALRLVHGWYVANESDFYNSEKEKPKNGWLGKWDNKKRCLAFFQDKLIDFLTKQKYDAKEVLSLWKNRGWLLLEKNRPGLTDKVSIEAGRANMYCIKLDAIETVCGGDDEEEENQKNNETWTYANHIGEEVYKNRR